MAGRVSTSEMDVPPQPPQESQPEEVKTIDVVEQLSELQDPYTLFRNAMVNAIPTDKIPSIAYEISEDLYNKAEKQNDKLTDSERALLLSRGDLIGTILGQPDSLAPETVGRFLDQPAPKVIRTNIERVTGGRFNTPAELWAKARGAREIGKFTPAFLSDDEVSLLMHCFHATEEAWLHQAFFNRNASQHIPGQKQAMNLLLSRQGWDSATAAALNVYIVSDPGFKYRKYAHEFPQREMLRQTRVTTFESSDRATYYYGNGPGGEPLLPWGPRTDEDLARYVDKMEQLLLQWNRNDITDAEYRQEFTRVLGILKVIAQRRNTPIIYSTDQLRRLDAPPAVSSVELQPVLQLPVDQDICDRPGRIWPTPALRTYPWMLDRFGHPLWPPLSSSKNGFRVFMEARPDVKNISTLWHSIGEQEQAIFNAMAESDRMQAWAEYEDWLENEDWKRKVAALKHANNF